CDDADCLQPSDASDASKPVAMIKGARNVMQRFVSKYNGAMFATQFNPALAHLAPAISVHTVSPHYGTGEARKQVLFGDRLDVRPGEIVIMTGQSGWGKTTLLTLIGTLRRVQQGDLTVLGQELRTASDAELVRLRRR